MSAIRTENGVIIKRKKYSPSQQAIAYERALMTNPLCKECEFNDKPFMYDGKKIASFCALYGKVLRRVPIFGFHTPCESHKKRKRRYDNQTQ